MNNSIGFEELDKSLELLEKYTERERHIYTTIKESSKKFSTYSYALSLTLNFFSILLFIFNKNVLYDSKTLILLIALPLISFVCIVLYFYLRQKDLLNNNKENLLITHKQLKSLVSIISQYSEHNNKSLSDMRKFELNIKLIEAEEILKNVGEKFPYDIKKNDPTRAKEFYHAEIK